jgi:uncharacterized Zn finger protein
MRILFDTEEIKERCNGCESYFEHNVGKTSESQPVWKCRNCGRLTVWMGGDTERVVTPGTPPVGV